MYRYYLVVLIALLPAYLLQAQTKPAAAQVRTCVEADSLALASYEAKQTGEALAYARRVLQLAPQQSCADSVLVQAFTILGLIYEDLGKLDSALYHYHEALNRTPDSLGTHADLLNCVGLVYLSQKRFNQAEIYLQASLRNRIKLFGESGEALSTAYNNLAHLYDKQARYDLALRQYQEALRLAKQHKGDTSRHTAVALVNLGSVYQKLEEADLAEAHFLQALEIAKKLYGDKNANYTIYLGHLANFYESTQRYHLAEQFFLQSKDICQSSLGENHPRFALALHNLGALYTHTKRYAEAEDYLSKALAIRENRLGKQHDSYLLSLRALAYAQRLRLNYAQAEVNYRNFLNLAPSALSPDLKFMYPVGLYELGELYQAQKRYTQAEALHLRALAVLDSLASPTDSRYLRHLNRLAQFYLSIEQYEKAEEYLNRGLQRNLGLDIRQALADSLALAPKTQQQQSAYIKNLWTWQRLYNQRYKSSENPALLDSSQAILLKIYGFYEARRGEMNDEEDKLRLYQDHQADLSQGLQIALRLQDQGKDTASLASAFKLAEYNKAVLLADASRKQRARRNLPDSLAQREKQALQQIDRLRKAYAETRQIEARRDLRHQLNAAMLDYEQLRQTLDAQYPPLHSALAKDNSLAELRALQAELSAQTMLLEYVVAEDQVFVFSLQKDRLDLRRLGPSYKALQSRLTDLRRCLSDTRFISNQASEAYALYAQTAYWLYRELLAPSLHERQGIKHLLIVPDADLGHIPFEALICSPAPEQSLDYGLLDYALRHYSFSYSYSAGIWQENRQLKTGRGNGRILGMAAHYGAELDSLNLRNLRPERQLQLRSRLTPLPFAGKELEAIQSQIKGQYLYGAAANEANFKTLAPDYSILHLAAHGLLSKQHPMLSALAFSENLDSLEDNFLEAWEIPYLKLKADLVVLSACETGYGEFLPSEGVISLARPFMVAGVSSLLVSLWPVNDYTTSKIMPQYYQSLQQGLSKAEALRQAKLQYLEKADALSTHPAYWSAFILYGDEGQLRLSRQYGLSDYLFFSGLALLGLLSLWFFRKKLRKTK